MTKKLARQLIEDYVKGWEQADSSRILKPLSDNCLIIESHGPTYNGLEQVKHWVKEWHQEGRVDKWEINSFCFVKNTAFFEWSFTCTTKGGTDSIEGASVVKFKGSKISGIHEYRMTEEAFDYYK